MFQNRLDFATLASLARGRWSCRQADQVTRMLAWSSRKSKFSNSMELRDRARLAAPVRHTLKSTDPVDACAPAGEGHFGINPARTRRARRLKGGRVTRSTLRLTACLQRSCRLPAEATHPRRGAFSSRFDSEAGFEGSGVVRARP